IEWITEHQNLIKPNTLLTDVTGVKRAVVPKIQSILRDDLEFIGSHPMAGRESYGIQNADSSIFKSANFIVTPTEKNTPEAIEICKKLGEILGFARISELSIDGHDKMIGFLSQLTHCIAISLMTCNTNDDLVKYTGDSFRDLIRIAKINDVMWPELFLLNKEYLTKEIDMFINELEKIKTYLDTDDGKSLQKMMKLSTERKIRFDQNNLK
ncbi:MAG: prephenate dehydrogenase/arogenate dehydrogenase family protein, partial [Clostridiales bacterium]|nr:prephenate dehydrogenase/arogenate dehydrogenase family protein [Clostridiales bacterium]